MDKNSVCESQRWRHFYAPGSNLHLWSLPSEQKCRYADITEKGLATWKDGESISEI
jgi:hypothetical protein